MRRTLWLLSITMLLGACPEKKMLEPEPPSGRCEVDFGALGVFAGTGTGAKAREITDASQLIGGPNAQGAVGDFLLENDRIRAIVQRPLRQIGPAPYGGAIIDVDLKRPAGQPGRDVMGKLTLLHSFGRTLKTTKVEVLRDGSEGGYAVVAATGEDGLVDYINVPNVIEQFLGSGVKLVVDPNAPLKITATTYFVISPGESRVRLLTAVCNDTNDTIVTSMGDLFEQGGASDFFNPSGCNGGTGSHGCLVDPAPWYGYQADDVAFALRSQKITDLKVVEPSSALLSVSGVVGTLSGGENQAGLLTWTDPNASRRPGAFGVLGKSSRHYLRDLFVARDLGGVVSEMAAIDAIVKARLDVTVAHADGAKAAGARIAVINATTGKQVTLLQSDADGRAKVDLAPGTYQVSTGVLGHAIEAPKSVLVPSTGSVEVALKVGASQKLTVNVKDAFNRPLIAKVLVVCPTGACTPNPLAYRPFFDVDDQPSNLARVGFVPSNGRLELQVPPGQYQVFVTRGPEYSAFPDTFPLMGRAVDLTTGPATIDAQLVRVVDTTGWMSGDPHVHGANSADSSVANALRVLSFAAEGMDVMISSDHDVITDFGPVIDELGAKGMMASMIGVEVTPFDYGHQHAFPVTRTANDPTGGAFDWAGGDGASLRLDALYAGLREKFPGTLVQLNHPRGWQGSLTALKVDTATGATHALPESFRMEPAPGATPADTKLLSHAFDAFEVQNGVSASTGVLNDWFTFLSRGAVKAATGASDTHNVFTNVGGYGRTWVKVGEDDPAKFDAAKFAQALRERRAVVSSGPFITMTARRLDSAGQPQGEAVDVGATAKIDAAAGEKLELTIDVQAPEWMQIDSIEVHSHASGRTALNGETNSTWPESRILVKKTFDPTTLPLWPVTQNGVQSRRMQLTEKIVVAPTADTWFVAMARSGSAARGLFPMAWGGVKCTQGVCVEQDTKPWAFTNALLVDADKSGSYDDFPLKPGQMLQKPPKVAPPAERRVPTEQEFAEALRRLLSHSHE